MTLAAGTRLGAYEIVSPLGAGGMGEVWRAKDTKLGRDVAIKVLPEEFFEDEERRLRFEREARTLASLNHPGIAAIHSFEEIPGSSSSSTRHLLVMELVEGEDLAQRLLSGPLPLDEALPVARQIAEALEAAHEKGIVHRDLKPANVKVTPDGRVKLLDFGLAKIFEGEASGDKSGSGGGLTKSPTMTARATAAGVILGTAAYMSPEQARGKAVDKRTDVWAFGCVLYEMLTGKRAFEGETVSDTLAAVLMKEPDWSALRVPGVSSKVVELLRRCLQRDAKQRLRDIGDARISLEEETGSADSSSGRLPFEDRQADPDSTVGRSASPSRERGSRRALVIPWSIAAALAVALGALALRSRTPQSTSPSFGLVRLDVTMPEKTTLGLSLAVSPDGRQIAFTGFASDEASGIWVRPLSESTAKPVRGAENGKFPFWSPDGRSLGFFAGGKLALVEVATGIVQTLCDAPDGRGGAWGADDVILFAPSTRDPLFRVSARGGTPVPATTLSDELKQTSHRWPSFLPDGKRFIFVSMAASDEGRGVFLSGPGAPKPRRLTGGVGLAQWAEPGGLLLARNNRLVFLPVDLTGDRPPGAPVVVAEGLDNVGNSGPTAYSPFSVSRGGVLAYRQYDEAAGRLAFKDRSGRLLDTPIPPGSFVEFSLSPDGKRVVAGATGGAAENNVWMLDLVRNTVSRLTFGKGEEASPVFSPDGERVAYSSDRNGKSDIFARAASGVGAEELLWKSDEAKWPDDWTKDGRALLVESQNPRSQMDLWLLPLGGDRRPVPLLTSPANEAHSALSPDGRYFSYTSDETGRSEIYVQSFPPGGGKWQVSAGGGDQALWRRDGKELFYLAADGRLMAVPVSTSPSFSAGAAQALFDAATGETTPSGVRNFYIPAPDGSKFLLLTYGRTGKTNSVHVVLNWKAEPGSK
ncbi:MAG TPA: protein kinase [Thermoanaerobaculia bacterium]|nr:protein kinase [Thermoanaerobaculia bacterium]